MFFSMDGYICGLVYFKFVVVLDELFLDLREFVLDVL